MKSLIVAIAAAATLSGVAHADPFADRQALMKDRGAQLRVQRVQALARAARRQFQRKLERMHARSGPGKLDQETCLIVDLLQVHRAA